MEGGMAGNFLDPAAQEFHPAVAPAQFTLPPPPAIYCPYGAAPAQALPMPFYPSTQLNPSPYVSPAAALPDTKPTRSLLLSSVAPQTMESTVRVEMEAFGGVRAVEMGRLHGEGLITVHFYDLRSAQAAVAEIREQHVRQQSLMGQQYGFVGMVPGSSSSNWAGGWAESCSSRIGGYCGGGGQVVVPGRGLVAGRAVWAQFAPEAPGLDGPNNGSLVVFNLDSNVSSAALKDVFQVFGAVKELRETPLKPRHRFVEFFDIRDAARALCELNGKEVFGKRIVIEFSRPGGQQARSYCRKGSAQPTTPLPPRLLRLPRTHSFSGDRSSSPSGARATSRSPPAPPIARECSLELTPDRATAADKIGARRGKGRSAGAGSSTTKLQSGRHKGWKGSSSGKGRPAAEARFLIKETTSSGGSAESPSSSSCIDTRTTVMIKNIPNKYSQKLLLNMLDNHCIHCNERISADGDESEPASAYDFVYLPIDFNNKCNVGYGFVNLTSPEATWRFYKAFHMQPWEVFNSRKICQVTYARLQGLEALKEHFKNSKFACDTDEYMPVVFFPPRDGKALTDPVPVGSRGAIAVLTNSGKRKMAALMEEMGAPSTSDDRPTDGASCSSPGKTAMSDRLEGEVGSCSGGGDDACDDDDYEGREPGGGGVVDMTDFTEAFRHHHL